MINGSSGMIIGLDRRDVDITEWYNLTLSNAEQIKFYKNGRIGPMQSRSSSTRTDASTCASKTAGPQRTATGNCGWMKSHSEKTDS